VLKPEENERLVRVGRGTPAGELFRRYWMPALLSSEIAEVDGPPVRVRLLAAGGYARSRTWRTSAWEWSVLLSSRSSLRWYHRGQCGLAPGHGEGIGGEMVNVRTVRTALARLEANVDSW